MNMTKCPHPTCKQMKPRDTYACILHWKTLPQTIRDKINLGFRGNSKLLDDGHKEATNFWELPFKGQPIKVKP